MEDNSLATMEADDVLTESRRYGNHLGVEFGAVYRSAAVVADGTNAPDVNDDYSDYSPSATPGARGPHHWLGSTDAKLSTIDLVGTGFTLLTGPEGGVWMNAAHAIDAPIDTYQVGAAGLFDPAANTDHSFEVAYGIGSGGAVVLRPDGHVAWRTAEAVDPARAEEILTSLVAGVTARTQGQPS